MTGVGRSYVALDRSHQRLLVEPRQEQTRHSLCNCVFHEGNGKEGNRTHFSRGQKKGCWLR